MTKYLISFPSAAMDVTADELPAVADAAHAVVDEIKAAGAYVFTGGIDESLAPLMVAGDGTVTKGTYPQTKELDGGMIVIDVPTRDEALRWAAKLAAACRCPQELRAFQYDPLV